MPLHPQCAALCEAAAKAGSPFGAGDAPAIRQAYEAGTANFSYDPGPLARVEDLSLAGPAGPIPARLYQATTQAAPAPTLVYYHGGGWAAGNLATHDHLCRHLALASGCIVIAIDYRLAPEHPFPAALDDCLAATREIHRRAAALGVDANRIANGGDSAGGSLATLVAIELRDAGEKFLRAQLLIYPSVDLAGNFPSMRENGQGYLLTHAAMEMFVNWYVPNAADREHPRASPLRAASLAGLPPALVLTAEFDPLRDEGLAYAEALRAAGVQTDYQCYAGMIHGFSRMGAKVDDGKRSLEDAATWLGSVLR